MRLMPLLCVALVAWLYLPALDNGLVWDDPIYLRGYPEYWVPDMWLHSFTEPLFISVNYYRPLVNATFLLDVHFFGGTDQVFHLSSLVIHLLATLVFGAILARLAKISGSDGYWALLGMLLYGCSPLMTEVVSWVSGRFDLLVNLFLMLVLWADLKFRGLSRIVLVALAYFLAAGAKEMAVGFGFIYPLWHVYLARLQDREAAFWPVVLRRENRDVYLAVIFAGLCYLLQRYLALGYLLQPDKMAGTVDAQGWELCLLVLKTIGGYGQVVFGYAGNIYPVYPLQKALTIADSQVVVGAAMVFSSLVLSFMKVRVGLVLLMFILSLTPVLNLVPLNISDNYMHLRFLAFPYSLTLLALFALFMIWVNTLARPAIVVVPGLLLLIAFSALTVRNIIPLWTSDQTLWSWANQRYPDYSLASVNLVVAASNAGNHQGAIDKGERLLEGGVEFKRQFIVHEALADSYFKSGDLDNMRRQYEMIFRHYSSSDLKARRYASIYARFAFSLFTVQPDDPAIPGLLAHALSFNPEDETALLLSGIRAFYEGETDASRAAIERGLAFMEPSRRRQNIEYLRSVGIYRQLLDLGMQDFSEH